VTLASIAAIEELFDAWGDNRYDEDLSQLAHALQCAALADAAGATPELVAAALLHDIGHLVELQSGGGADFTTDLHHEDIAVLALAEIFPRSVTDPIALHVQAKRFLVATEPAYVTTLSAGSRRSLTVQGGPMNPAECERFITQTGATDAVTLRRWDDSGKVEGLSVKPFATYRPMLDRLAFND
jgi:phosphonate degradation associated HDIG domain protein